VNREQLASLITPQTIMRLHKEASDRYGGDPTQRSQDIECADGRIGSAGNAAAYCAEGDEDMGLILVAYLLYYLAKDHCFVDGNKRVAWLAAVETLKNLQLTLNVSTEDAYAFMIDLSSEGSTITASDVAVWLAERLEDVVGEPVN
jgi:death-on-curing protein